jgi:hypothetical protein
MLRLGLRVTVFAVAEGIVVISQCSGADTTTVVD